MKVTLRKLNRLAAAIVFGRWLLAGIAVHLADARDRLESSLAVSKRRNLELQARVDELKAEHTRLASERLVLMADLKRYVSRLDRRDEEIESLTRQRDTALDMLERIQWDARTATAKSMVVANGLQSPVETRPSSRS